MTSFPGLSFALVLVTAVLFFVTFLIEKHIADGTVFLPLVNADTAILWVRERSRSILKPNRWLQHLTVGLISSPCWCGDAEPWCRDTEPCH